MRPRLALQVGVMAMMGAGLAGHALAETPAPKAAAAPTPSASPAAAKAPAPPPKVAGPRGPGRGFPAAAPWVSFYGAAKSAQPIARIAETFRVINIDADPGVAAWTPAQIAELKGGGRNRVLSYMNVGSCEAFREYFTKVPKGFVPCGKNTRAQRGRYAGYPDEIWMDLADPDYARLIVEHVAARLVATGVDGFYLDNMEIVEHGDRTSNGPCGDRCSQGGLDLVGRLRAAFPQHLIVMQNATSDVTRLGKTSAGIPFPQLLDGIAHESVFAPQPDPEALAQMKAWKAMNLQAGGRPFFIAVEDYVGSCKAVAKARRAYAQARQHGFSPYATDASAGQQRICYWGF